TKRYRVQSAQQRQGRTRRKRRYAFDRTSGVGFQNMRIVMAQRNPLVGDIEGNADRVLAAAREARTLLGAELVLFPELMLTGYPPEDLLLRPSLNSRIDEALAHIGEGIEVPVV